MPEWLKDAPWLWWVGAALAFGIIEMTTLDLLFLMLALGAVVGAIAAGAGAPLVLQAILFIGSAGLFVLALRPTLVKYMRLEGKGAVLGVEGHVGQNATVLEEVSDRDGLVKLRGENWTARAELAGDVFAVDEIVEVVNISGATAVVRRATPEDKPFEVESP